MRAKVITTITTELDLNTMESDHSVSINDCDRLGDVSGDVVGAVVIGGLHSTMAAVRDRYPRAARADQEPCEPTERITDDGVAIDCACGEKGSLWSHRVGARTAYLQHVAERIAGDQDDWHGSVDVDYREDED